MDHLPKDPAILLSSVNMLLRDKEFDSLNASRIICSRPDMCTAKSSISSDLSASTRSNEFPLSLPDLP